jgi:hypothetical protein
MSDGLFDLDPPVSAECAGSDHSRCTQPSCQCGCGHAQIDQRKGRHRRNDYATSVVGAEAVAYRAGSQKARLLAAYRRAGGAGLSDDEAAIAAGLPLTSCYWKRCGELRQDGKILDTGQTRIGFAGVPRIVSRMK